MSDPSTILAIDCALGGCIGALAFPGGQRSFSHETGNSQAADLVPLIDCMLTDAGIAYSDIDLIVAGIGPGSFTGVRIGLSTARAFGLALSVPVIGVDTFHAMAATCFGPEIPDCLVVLESKRTDFYTQVFSDRRSEQAMCLNADDIQKLGAERNLILCGDGLTRLRVETADGAIFKDAVQRVLTDPLALMTLGKTAFEHVKGNISRPEPIYLRGADVSMSNKRPRVIKSE